MTPFNFTYELKKREEKIYKNSSKKRKFKKRSCSLIRVCKSFSKSENNEG